MRIVTRVLLSSEPAVIDVGKVDNVNKSRKQTGITQTVSARLNSANGRATDNLI